MVAAFYLAVMFAPSHRFTLLTAGTMAIFGCWTLAGRWGVDLRAGGEMVPVFLGVVLLVAMPVAWQAPVPVPTMFTVVLGIVAAEATYAARRFPVFPPAPPQSLWSRVGAGLLFGILMAILVSLVATVPMAMEFFSGTSGQAKVDAYGPLVYRGYLVGGAAAGLLVGLLRPLNRWPLGTMFLGVLGGVCVYGAIGPAAELVTGETWPLSEMIGIALAAGLLAGPPAALMLRYDGWAAPVFGPHR